MHSPAQVADRRARAVVATVLVAAVFVSLGLVVATLEQADGFLETSDAVAVDTAVSGPRIYWSRAAVEPRGAESRPAQVRQELYTRWCAACHGTEGAGDGPLAKALAPPPRDFTKGRFRLRSTPEGSLPSDADLYRTLTAGILPSRMPSFAFLPAEDRWALVDHVKGLSSFFDSDEDKVQHHFELNPPEPEVDFGDVKIDAADAAAVARGRVLYMEKGECWKCHGKEGLGDGPSAPTLAAEEGNPLPPANLRRGPLALKGVADAKDVYRVLTLGISGTPMPNYAATLGADAVKDLAAFTAAWWRLEPRALDRRLPGGNVKPTAAESTMRLGHETYLTNCAGCHGKLGLGNGAPAVGFAVKPANLAAGSFKFKSTPEGCAPTAEDLKRTIRRGVPGTSMPAWRLHTEAELDALVTFVLDAGGSKGRKGAPVSTPVIPPDRVRDPAAAARGAELYKATCAACHGGQGAGDGTFAEILQDLRGERIRPRNFLEDPMRLGERPEDLYRALTLGFEGTPMPGFAGLYDEASRLDLVAFLLSLRDTGARLR